jgi:chromosomal replication initiator protein
VRRGVVKGRRRKARAAIDEQLTLIWNEAREQIRGRVNDATFRLWFERTVPVGLDEGTFVVGLPNEFARDWVESRFGDTLREAIGAVMAADVDVRLVVDERAAELDVGGGETVVGGGERSPAPAPVSGDGVLSVAEGAQADSGGLNSRYIFDRWVVGPHNEYATAVARSVAEAPGSAYNPVFVYADTGLGKTHLIQAIAHEIFVADPARRVKYVTCEQFIDDFISGVSEKGRIEGFKQQYRTNDVLLIDDVQFLAGKQGTQVEFFHTFNALYEADRQIVLTSDRQPRELEELDDRLRSRFGQGVVVDIGRPDVETRIAILRRQVKVDAYTIGEPEVLEYIASRVSTNIRELVGALRRVVSYASITHGEVTLEVAREALKDILPKPYTQPITIEAVQSEVARQFGCHVSDLRGDKRTADVAYPRHIAMYLCRELTEASLPQIGGRFGGRDHSTVLYAVNKIERLMQDGHDRQLHDLVQVITSRLQTGR